MNDTITADSSWCGTFQLVWNDMKNEVVKKDVIFNPQLDMVKNIGGENDYEKMENLIRKIDELKDRIGIKRTIREWTKRKI